MKKIKILTIILLIILITMVAFWGIYTQVQNRMENQVRDYSYAMDLAGSRVVRLIVSTGSETTVKDSEGNVVEDSENLTDEEITANGYTKEETPYNSDDVKTVDNYRKSKEIIEKRFNELGISNYITKLDEKTGDIIVEITENDDTDSIVSNLATTGKFEIVDSQTQEVLMDNSDIKLANVMYGADSSSATSSGTMVYLNIEFTKEGTSKLEEISTNYTATTEDTNTTSEDTNTTDENATTDETNTTNETSSEDATSDDTSSDDTTEKTITMKIDGEEIMTTSFDEPIRTGRLQLSIGYSTTDTDTLNGYINQASNMAVVLDTGNMPVRYEVDTNEFIESDITQNQLQIVSYIMLGIVGLALIVLIIRYRILGLLGAFSYVGLMSILLLIIRYANVVLSMEGIFGIAIVLILNYIFVNKFLNKLKDNRKDLSKEEVIKANKETYKEFFIRIIPVIIMVIAFSFVQWTPISSFGMVMIWGIALIAAYNVIFTNNLLKLKAKKD